MHRHFFVEDGETRDINRRYGGCLFLNIRIKGNQTFYTAEIEIAVAAFYRRLVIELIAAQAVVYGEDTRISFVSGLKRTNPLLVPNHK